MRGGLFYTFIYYFWSLFFHRYQIIYFSKYRSVGGSYDNEGVAIFALIFCFYLWVKSVHTGKYLTS